MPMPAFIHAPIHMMSWVDIEEVIVPGAPPVPGPPTPYNALQFMTGIFPGVPIMGSSPLTDAKVMTIIGPPLAHGTDIGMMVPHFSPSPNLLLPLILLGSSSKNLLGASTVKIGNKPVATAIPVNVLGMNLNCSFPISLPSLVASPHTVMAGITLGDMLGALFRMVVAMGFDSLMRKIGLDKLSIPGLNRVKAFIARRSGWNRLSGITYREVLESAGEHATQSQLTAALRSADKIIDETSTLIGNKTQSVIIHGVGSVIGRDGIPSDLKGVTSNLADDLGHGIAGEDYNVVNSVFGGEKVESH